MKLVISSDDIICGIMTGTSLDGLDISFSKFSLGSKLKVDLLAHSNLPFPPSFSEYVKSIINNPRMQDISFLHYFLSELYFKAIIHSAEVHKIDLEHVSLIGFHGQTMWHQANGYEKFGIKIPSTLQLGNASALASKIKIPVINDFRAADIALGGQGAPLVPRFDYDYFRDSDYNKVCLNIGGMANITYLEKNISIENLIAFDTGAGNVLIDLATKKYFIKEYDKDGEIARSGELVVELFEKLMNDEFIKAKPPKSTGREHFNEEYLTKFNIDKYEKNDVITTLTYFTAKSIEYNIKEYCGNVDEIIVSGGGARNLYLISLLESLFPNKEINTSEFYNIPIDAKESIAFAYLAFRTANGLSSNIPSVTGAKSETILGSISF